MSYTLTTATTEVRNLLNESTAAFWTDAEIQGWIQQAVLDISSKLLCVRLSDTVALVNDQFNYTNSDASFFSACLKPKQVFYWNITTNEIFGLQKVMLEQFGHEHIVDSRPRYYYFDSASRTLFVAPTPDSTVSGVTHVLYVVYSYVTNDITLLKDEYQPLVFLYACYKAKLKERLYQEAMMYYQIYKDSVLFERQDKYDLGEETNDDLLIK